MHVPAHRGQVSLRLLLSCGAAREPQVARQWRGTTALFSLAKHLTSAGLHHLRLCPCCPQPLMPFAASHRERGTKTGTRHLQSSSAALRGLGLAPCFLPPSACQARQTSPAPLIPSSLPSPCCSAAVIIGQRAEEYFGAPELSGWKRFASREADGSQTPGKEGVGREGTGSRLQTKTLLPGRGGRSYRGVLTYLPSCSRRRGRERSGTRQGSGRQRREAPSLAAGRADGEQLHRRAGCCSGKVRGRRKLRCPQPAMRKKSRATQPAGAEHTRVTKARDSSTLH